MTAIGRSQSFSARRGRNEKILPCDEDVKTCDPAIRPSGFKDGVLGERYLNWGGREGDIQLFKNSVCYAATALLCSFISCIVPQMSYGSETSPMVRFSDTVPATGGRNLVPNGSFEAGQAGWSSLGHGAGYENAWAPLVANWGNFATLHGTVEGSGGTDGQAFLRIRLGDNDTPIFNFDYFSPVNHRELRPLAANQGWIEVTPGQPYTFSVQMRASRDGVPAAFGVQNEDAGNSWDGEQEEILTKVELTGDWKRYSHTFVPKYPFLFVLAGPDLTKEEEVAVDVDSVQLEKGTVATNFAFRNELEIGIVPSEPAGVFTAGEPAGLKISAYNSSGAPAQARIIFRATDFSGEPVDLPAVDMEVPAASAMTKLISLPTQWRGFYRVVAVCRNAQTEETHLLRIAIVPPRTARESVIGVNHAYPTAFLIGLAKKAGVSWYRDWSLKWQHIEPEKGKLQWQVSDPQMDRVVAQDVNLMAMVPFPSTDWNSTAPSLETLRAESPPYRAGGIGDGQELLPRARWAWMPQNVSELSGFIGIAVGRYKRQVRVWEFLNEPLYTNYSLPDSASLNSKTLKGYTMEDYLTLLREVVPAIRTANPDARIMGGPAMNTTARYTIAMVEAGLLNMVDILGVHDYPVRVTPEDRLLTSIDKLLATMKAHGGPKPIWMTEFSYFGTDDLPREPFVPIPGLWSEPKLLSEKEVADYTIRYCTIFLGRGGEKIFLHSGCTGSVNKPGTESCMFADGAVRKVFPAVAVFTELMGPSPTYVADSTNGSGLVFAFETENQATLVLWDPSERATNHIPNGATCLDIMGRKVEGPEVRLTASPVYFVGQAGRAKQFFAECIGN